MAESKRKCRVCECSDRDACRVDGGCSWIEADLCSACAEMISILFTFRTIAGAGATRLSADIVERLVKEVDAAIDTGALMAYVPDQSAFIEGRRKC